MQEIIKMKDKKYLTNDGGQYTINEMVDRVVYWWKRFEGTRTEDGKDYSRYDVEELSIRLKKLSKRPEDFNFNHPDFKKDEFDDEY